MVVYTLVFEHKNHGPMITFVIGSQFSMSILGAGKKKELYALTSCHSVRIWTRLYVAWQRDTIDEEIAKFKAEPDQEVFLASIKNEEPLQTKIKWSSLT